MEERRKVLMFAEGHVLWTMREDYHMKKSDYGLLDENLAKLEKEGKCIVLKQGEKFTDPHSNLTGLIYVVKRIDKEDFEPEIVPTPEIVVDAIKRAASDDHVYDDVRNVVCKNELAESGTSHRVFFFSLTKTW